MTATDTEEGETTATALLLTDPGMGTGITIAILLLCDAMEEEDEGQEEIHMTDVTHTQAEVEDVISSSEVHTMTGATLLAAGQAAAVLTHKMPTEAEAAAEEEDEKTGDQTTAKLRLSCDAAQHPKASDQSANVSAAQTCGTSSLRVSKRTLQLTRKLRASLVCQVRCGCWIRARSSA